MGRKRRSASSPAYATPPSPPQSPPGELEIIRGLLREARTIWPWLVAVAVVAGLLRFIQLGEASLWMDEIVIIQEAYLREYRTVSFRAHSAHLVPVSILLNAFGQTAFVLRLWSAILGTLACPVLMLWAHWTAGRGLAIPMGIFTATSCFLLMYSQDGNYYAGMVFYLAIQLVGYALFFRGAPHAGMMLAIGGGVLALLNHPISVIPTATIIGGMLVGSLVFPSVRSTVWSTRPSDWRRRPLLPILAIGFLCALPVLWRVVPRVHGFLSGMIDPGAATLTNVELGARLFLDHGTGLMVNFHRTEPWHRFLGGGAWVLAAVGLASSFLLARRTRDISLAAFAGLVVVTLASSYAVLFSLSLNRNFNLRYFSYLVPLLGAAALMAPMFLAQSMAERFRAYLPLLLLPFVLPFTVRYMLTDHSNYRAAASILVADGREATPILAATRNDTVEAAYYLSQAGLPSLPPQFAALNQPGYADLFAGPLPFVLSQSDDLWILSAWRYVEQPRLYRFLDDSVPLAYSGRSKWGSEHDLKIYRWRADAARSYPRLASRAADRTVTMPTLPESLRMDFHQAANMPEHTRYFLSEGMLRNERDGSIDFMVFQPTNRRRLVVEIAAPDPADALLRQNAGPIPGGIMVGIAVDGVHRGFWSFRDSPGQPFSFSPDLDLPAGNHRITIIGCMPRLDYTPYFPWRIAGIEWSIGVAETAAPSDEARGMVRLSPGWSAVPIAGEPGGVLSADWQVSSPSDVTVDETVRGPAGDPAIRIWIPGESRDPFMLAAPPMAVIPGTLATYWFYLQFSGLEHQELTPIHIFLDSKGQPLGGNRLANGPNIRGMTLGKSWIRRQVTVPVPDDAAYLIGGFQSLPLPRGRSDGATIRVASFASPGVTGAQFSDPALSDSYFGFGEEAAVGDGK